MSRNHQREAKGGSLPRAALVFALVLIALLLIGAVRLAEAYGHWLLLAAALAVGARLVLAVVRFARATPQARRNYPHALWARVRWRWLVRNLGLAYEDRHRRGRLVRNPAGTSVAVYHGHEVRVRYPRARIRADHHGLVATVKTVPKTGRREFEDQAEHIANAWGCARVQVSQPKPGRLVVRGLRTDPLAVPLALDQVPAGVYGTVCPPRDNCPGADNSAPASNDAPVTSAGTRGLRKVPHPASNDAPWRPYLGLDEWGQHRYADLSGVTGITIAGLPGYGKTSLVLSLLHQLAGSAAVQFAFIDGKGGGDYAGWRDRAWLFCDDELDAAAGVLEDVHALMRKRLAAAGEGGRPRNMWHQGPSADYPLIVTVIDEAHSFYDLDGVKGDQKADRLVRTCRTLTGQLVKKGRSALFVTILITQKQTGDAIPTAIRDNCSIGFSFAVKTRDAAVAGLGEAIRDYPSYCPTGLLERPTYIGVCTSSLPTGADPFVRLRVPEISEAAAAERARATAHLRRDPVSNENNVPLAPLAVAP